MGNLDSVSKVFVQKPDVFRDVFKLIWGDKRTKIEDLVTMEPEMLFAKRLPIGKGKTKRASKRQKMRKAAILAKFTRDIVKDCICATGNTIDCMLLAVENQSYVDGLMPARVMIYDAMTFHIQMEALKAQDWAKLQTDAFLTGVPTGTKLKPVLTVVCYFGTKPWNGPRCLHEMLEINDPELKSLIPNYPIHIIDPHELTEAQLATLDTTLREVFLCIKASTNRKLLKEIVKSNHRFQHMDLDAVNLIKTALNIDIKIDSNQEEINMCQAVEEWKQELLDEGYENGKKAGEKAGYENGKKAGYENGEKAILKTLLQNSGLALEEIARMTRQPLSLLKSLAAQEQ